MKYARQTSSARSTKRALIASAVCTVLCGLLLFSASVAWFSATKESKVNELYSGNLDVVLSYSKTMAEGSWQPVTTGTDDIFKVKGAGETEQNMLWEPGAVNVVYFKVENNGNLAAKYDFAVEIGEEVEGTNFNDQPFKLSDYIYGGVVEDVSEPYETSDVGREAAITAISESEKTLSAISGSPLITDKMEGIPAGSTEPADHTAKTFALVLYMPQYVHVGDADVDVGEMVNYPTPENNADRPKVPLKVKLVATQDIGENDSFGSEYDKSAYEIKVPAGATPQKTQENLVSVVTSAAPGSTIRLPASSEIKITDDFKNKQLTVKGEGASTVIADTVYELNGISFENVTLDASKFSVQEQHKGFKRPGNITYTNCTIKGDGKYALYGDTEIFKGCTLTMDTYEYILWTYGAKNVVFEDCTFITKGKAMKIYHDACTNDTHNVTFTNCTFKIADGYTNTGNKPAIAVDARGSVFTIIINGCTVEGYKYNDDAMTTWYNTYMNGATNTQKMMIGCEGAGIGNVHVTIDGTEFN